LGFTEADRVENIRRVGEVATTYGRRRTDCDRRLYFRHSERSVKWFVKLFDTGEFIEVFVDTPLAECERVT
jgi:bifunctional enzyme CysN/CysC